MEILFTKFFVLGLVRKWQSSEAAPWHSDTLILIGLIIGIMDMIINPSFDVSTTKKVLSVPRFRNK